MFKGKTVTYEIFPQHCSEDTEPVKSFNTYAECKDFLHPIHRELFKRYLEEISLSGKIALQEDALVKERKFEEIHDYKQNWESRLKSLLL